ncbi:hypothetical protein AVEN_201246-1, partial [Araneus ventricosus]
VEIHTPSESTRFHRSGSLLCSVHIRPLAPAPHVPVPLQSGCSVMAQARRGKRSV